MMSIACIKNLKEMPPAFFFSSLEDGEMAHSIFTVLPQGDVAYSISFFLLKCFSLLLFASN